MSEDSRFVLPLLKWVGGKTQLLPRLLEFVPRKINHYYEPFAGGAALFLALEPVRATISDLNPKLINFYKQVASSPREVMAEVNEFSARFQNAGASNLDTYISMRTEFNELSEETPRSAALLLVLNKTCFNGLYRENSKGEFNVPFNHFKNLPAFFNEANFMRASTALSGAEIVLAGFEKATEKAGDGDFVYFDPPYVPLSETSSFTSYSSSGFGPPEQLSLLNRAVELRSLGVKVLLSNSYSPWVIENYSKNGFKVMAVPAKRNVAASSDSRAPVMEALILGY